MPASPLTSKCPHCGGQIRLKDRDLIGKKIRCPRCQEPFVATASDSQLVTAALPRKTQGTRPTRPTSVDRGEDQDEPEADRKKAQRGKKKKSKGKQAATLPLILIGAGVVAVDTATGTTIWTGEAAAASGVAVAGGIVYVGTTDDRLVGFSPGVTPPSLSSPSGTTDVAITAIQVPAAVSRSSDALVRVTLVNRGGASTRCALSGRSSTSSSTAPRAPSRRWRRPCGS